MNDISIRQLKIINTLIKCQSAVKAAQELKISPSAISYSLNQLKKQMGQELFVRTRSGLKPNEHALALQKKFEEISQLSSIKNEFVIATYSLIEMLLAEHIHLGSDALMHFTTMATCPEERLRKLKHREVDIDIGGKLPDDRAIVSRRFVRSETCILTAADHPRIQQNFTLEDWLENEHLSWQRGVGSLRGMVDKVDVHLMTGRKIAWTSPNLLALAWHCSASEYVMIMPKMFIPFLQARFPLKAHTPPPALEMTFECYLHYHRAMEENINALNLDKISTALNAL
ncbi:MAG: LysR family transcriptional regulator [Scandinavium sp.]|uniref:LysR family transcriptional regulator n=1 Tax=Scandinavium sp. TaxID=2830653 RepID=UPI003F3E570A